MSNSAIEISAGDYQLVLTPTRGGSIARFEWRDLPLMRATCGKSILDTACFPLVPFSNRIAHGRFEADTRSVQLPPNFPGGGHPHPLHGFGWQVPWKVINIEPDSALLLHRHVPGDWPWAYEAEQRFALSPKGLVHELAVRNLATEPMPAGLGFHPYFPRDPCTRYHSLHRGEWHTSHDGLPILLREASGPIDWWQGTPVSARSVDTAYTGREGPLIIEWPERGARLTIEPSAALLFTVVYTPADTDFFCVEPVSQASDAINRSNGVEMRWLAPGERFDVSVSYVASEYIP